MRLLSDFRISKQLHYGSVRLSYYDVFLVAIVFAFIAFLLVIWLARRGRIITTLKGELSSLRSSLESFSKQNGALKDKVNSFKKRQEQYVLNNVALGKKIAELNTLIDDNKRELQNSNQRLKEQNTRLISLRKTNKEQSKKISEYASEVSVLTQQKEDALTNQESQKSSYEAEITILKDEIRSKNQTLTELSKKLSELESIQQKDSDKITQLNSEIETLKNSENELLRQNQILSEEVAGKNIIIDHQQSLLKEQETKASVKTKNQKSFNPIERLANW